MFVYYVTTSVFSFIRFLGPLYRLLLWWNAFLFKKELAARTGEKFILSIVYGQYWPEVSLVAADYQTRDWKPQFRFAVRRDLRGILLDSLKFPAELRNRGFGQFCVKWLKKFCRRFGFSFIVLGAYPEAEEFWRKMKFIALEFAEWRNYWHQD